MKLVHAERLGEAFDSQLVIGVRESYGNDTHTHTLVLIVLQDIVNCYNTSSIRGLRSNLFFAAVFYITMPFFGVNAAIFIM